MNPATHNAIAPPIRGWLPTTLIDFEGRVASIVFLGGCNFRCRVCHAGGLVIDPSVMAPVHLEDIMAHVTDPDNWIDGVVVSGGEPTLHPGLPVLIERFKTAGLDVKLDTNGTHPDMLRRLIDDSMLDYVAMDVKAPLDERYAEVAGVTVDLETIRRSIEMVRTGEVPGELRTTVAPGLVDIADVRTIAERDIAGTPLYILQKHRPTDCLDPAFDEVKPYTDGEMEAMREAAAPFVETCRIRGHV